MPPVAVERIAVVELVGGEGALVGDDLGGPAHHRRDQVGWMPCGLSMISSSAPNAAMVRSFSAANAFDVTIRRRVALHRADEGERAAGRPARVLDHGPPGAQQALALGALDHRQRHAVLVRAGRVGRLELHPHLGVVGAGQPREPDDGRVADGCEDA